MSPKEEEVFSIHVIILFYSVQSKVLWFDDWSVEFIVLRILKYYVVCYGKNACFFLWSAKQYMFAKNSCDRFVIKVK